MPVEDGEERQEKAENPREEDEAGDDIERCLKEYEETMNSLITDRGEGTGPTETEEPETNAGEESQSTNDGIQLSHKSDNNQHEEEKGEGEEKQGREGVGEPSQTLEQQYSSAESLQHSEISLTEQQDFDKTNKHQEGPELSRVYEDKELQDKRKQIKRQNS